MLKGQFINIDAKYFEVLGMAKVSIMLAFGFAGYNAEVTRREEVRAMWVAKLGVRAAERAAAGLAPKRANKGSRQGTRVGAVKRYRDKKERLVVSKTEEKRRAAQRKAHAIRPVSPPPETRAQRAPNTQRAMGRQRGMTAAKVPPDD
jgi:hypothetical protein